MSDAQALDRFLIGQDGVWERALAELRRGRKRSHWMWFIFPQIAGLGFSSTARFYAIRNLEEAAAYLQHPVLGDRLKQCCAALLNLQDRTASEIFGYPDDLKLRSSMTLFSRVPEADPVFAQVLEKYYSGLPDTRTIELLGKSQS